MPNHVVDPTWFFDALDLFTFEYDWFVQKGFAVDEMGRRITKFDKLKIEGSLQPEQTSLNFSENGNTQTYKYNFYCRSIFRIDIGDFIFYKNSYLHVDGVHEYDEYGVRSCTLTMINLNKYKDLKDYIDYLNGDKIV